VSPVFWDGGEEQLLRFNANSIGAAPTHRIAGTFTFWPYTRNVLV
jgi:hypothetical protein